MTKKTAPKKQLPDVTVTVKLNRRDYLKLLKIKNKIGSGFISETLRKLITDAAK